MLPIAAPAASILAASLPRGAPCSPFFTFFCFSCFSISVALAGKIAGNAKKSPPTAGPNCLAMTPAMAVMSPPKNKPNRVIMPSCLTREPSFCSAS
jgi:hypothetical protein